MSREAVLDPVLPPGLALTGGLRLRIGDRRPAAARAAVEPFGSELVRRASAAHVGAVHRIAVSLLLALLGSCASSSLVVDGRTGGEIELDALADELATRDVVILGEEHDSPEGHRLHHELLRELYARRPDLVLSMEMFERDAQEVLDRYLAGELDEEAFVDEARAWPHYAERYRPFVELAKARGLPVIAANVPRELAQQVAREGIEAAAGHPHAARETTAPRDEYYRRFRDAMTESGDGEGGAGEAGPRPTAEAPAWIDDYYVAQCLKDDTMAEAIVDALRAARSEGRDPLVVHVCGKFHSDYGQGTTARVLERGPELDVAVVGMESAARPSASAVELGGAVADYVVVVPEPEEREDDQETPHHPAPAEHETAEEEDRPAPPEPPAEAARPALGFLPDYGHQGAGVGIAEVLPLGPAEEAGLRGGDVLVRVGGVELAGLHDYVDVLGALEVGKEVEVVVDRDGERRTFVVVVGTRS